MAVNRRGFLGALAGIAAGAGLVKERLTISKTEPTIASYRDEFGREFMLVRRDPWDRGMTAGRVAFWTDREKLQVGTKVLPSQRDQDSYAGQFPTRGNVEPGHHFFLQVGGPTTVITYKGAPVVEDQYTPMRG